MAAGFHRWSLRVATIYMSSCRHAGRRVKLLRLEAGADEMSSFVNSKRNKQWVWIAIDTESKQVIALVFF